LRANLDHLFVVSIINAQRRALLHAARRWLRANIPANFWSWRAFHPAQPLPPATTAVL
jgi:hypothetical protein